MARLARVVVPGYPHHVTQRGNRRQPTFFSDEDYEAYLALMAEQCAERGVGVWAWCLMPRRDAQPPGACDPTTQRPCGPQPPQTQTPSITRVRHHTDPNPQMPLAENLAL